MPDTTEVENEEAEGQRLIHELQEIRSNLSEHASRHPNSVDVRSARSQVERAIDIATQASDKPYCDSAAKLWLGYVVDDYERIVRADAAAVAQRLYG